MSGWSDRHQAFAQSRRDRKKFEMLTPHA